MRRSALLRKQPLMKSWCRRGHLLWRAVGTLAAWGLHPRAVGALGSALAVSGHLALARADESELPPEVGYNYGAVEGARGGALGGALRAFGNSTDAVFTNPANMAAGELYHIGAVGEFWPEARRYLFGAAVVDSLTGRVAGGLGGYYMTQDPDGIDRSGGEGRLALAFPFSEKFMLGATGKYLQLRQDGPGPFGRDPFSGGLRRRSFAKTFSVDLGATVTPTKGFSIGLLGANLTNPAHGLLPLNVGGGIGVGSRTFTLEADVLGDFTTWNRNTVRAMAGFELLVADAVPLRLGYRYDDGAESHAISAGLGYVDRSFSAAVSGRRIVAGDAATAVFVSLTYHLESAEMGLGDADF